MTKRGREEEERVERVNERDRDADPTRVGLK